MYNGLSPMSYKDEAWYKSCFIAKNLEVEFSMKSKRRNKKHKKKKGDVYMRTAINKSMNNLKKRALERRISFPNQKSIEDVKIENDFFDNVKKKMYEQIMEDKRWN